jgi:hypothetical protein
MFTLILLLLLAVTYVYHDVIFVIKRKPTFVIWIVSEYRRRSRFFMCKIIKITIETLINILLKINLFQRFGGAFAILFYIY